MMAIIIMCLPGGVEMKINEAIYRLKYHFRVHDDGRPTPKLDEAVHELCDQHILNVGRGEKYSIKFVCTNKSL